MKGSPEHSQQYNQTARVHTKEDESNPMQTVRVRNRKGGYDQMKVSRNMPIKQGSQTARTHDKSQAGSYHDVKSATKKLAQLMRYKEEKLKREQEKLEEEKRQREKGLFIC